MVKPIPWGYKYSDESERAQISFCKQYIGLKTNTMDSFVLEECGRYCMAGSYMTLYKILAKINKDADSHVSPPML